MKVKVAHTCQTLCDGMECIVHEILQARTLEWVAVLSQWDLPNPGIESRSPTLQADSLPAKPPGNPKNTGVGSLFLLQRSSGPRKRTGVSCIAGGFFTS